MKRIVQILGPTGIGKSQISVQLSEKLNGEVISADSVQVYKGFDIGSSKIKDEEKSGVPHHLIDILEPSEQFNVNRFLEFSVSPEMGEVHLGVAHILDNGHLSFIIHLLEGMHFRV